MSAATSAWVVVTSPNPSTTSVSNNVLSGVAAITDSNVWAVGSYSSTSGNDLDHTLAEHWNGATWSIVSTPNPGTNGSSLEAVSADSSTDVWAVGETNTNPFGTASQDQTLIEHYNGSAWSVVPSPNPSNQGDVLTGVKAFASNNVWAVGYYLDTLYDSLDPLVLHWDGTSFTMFTSGVPVGSGFLLEAINGLSPTDIWAVGEDGFGDTNFEMHFNGVQWSVAPSASFPNGGQQFIAGVAEVSTDDVWAVGSYVPTVFAEQQTLALNWNGNTWSQVKTPNVDTYFNKFYAVAAVSASDVWAVGYAYTTSGLSFDTLIEHWNGVAWSIVSSPNAKGTTGNELVGIAVSGTTTLWSVGSADSTTKGNPGLRTLTEHTTKG